MLSRQNLAARPAPSATPAGQASSRSPIFHHAGGRCWRKARGCTRNGRSRPGNPWLFDSRGMGTSGTKRPGTGSPVTRAPPPAWPGAVSGMGPWAQVPLGGIPLAFGPSAWDPLRQSGHEGAFIRPSRWAGAPRPVGLGRLKTPLGRSRRVSRSPRREAQGRLICRRMLRLGKRPVLGAAARKLPLAAWRVWRDGRSARAVDHARCQKKRCRMRTAVPTLSLGQALGPVDRARAPPARLARREADVFRFAARRAKRSATRRLSARCVRRRARTLPAIPRRWPSEADRETSCA